GQAAAIRAALPAPLLPTRPDDPPLLEQLRHPNIADARSRPGTWTCPDGTWPGSWSRPGSWRAVTAGANFAPIARVERAWFRLQDRLAALSSRSVHAIALTSGHFGHEDEPDAVLAATRAAV